jgi:sigma-B regulation protein RsbU (phosphoserine phosphatase)
VSAYYLPHFDVGGDYYDWIRLNNGNDYCFCIADVSGKGFSAALLMSNFQANLRALASTGISLTEMVNKLNTKVIENVNGEKFITLFIAFFNIETRKMTYVNAGHNPPIYFNAESGEVSQLTQGCMGVGMLDSIPRINVGEESVPHGSKLICFTDGIVELENLSHQAFGTEPIEYAIQQGKSIVDDIDGIIESLYEHKGAENDFFDDITMLGIEFK